MTGFLKQFVHILVTLGILLSPALLSMDSSHTFLLQPSWVFAAHADEPMTSRAAADYCKSRHPSDRSAFSDCVKNHTNTQSAADQCSWNDMACFAGKGANLFLSITGKAVQFTGNILDHAIAFSLNLGDEPGVNEGVTIGWETFRDLANMVFIFALLYIAIATILQLSSFDTKKTLGTLIVVGLLLNFSLFATRIVVDASNVLGCFFYERVADISCGAGPPGGAVEAGSGNAATTGIAGKFADHLKIVSIYDVPTTEQADDFFSSYNLLLVGFFGSIFLLVLAFVFLMGAILFVIRSVALLFLMILSPLAFIGFALPYTTGKAKEWWNKLISYSFVAPVFLVFIFVVLEVMDGISDALVEGGTSSIPGFDPGFVDALSTTGLGSSGILFNFFLVTGLLVAAIIVSKNLGDELGSFATKSAGKIYGSTTGFLGRQSMGRMGNAFAQSKPVQKMASSKYVLPNTVGKLAQGFGNEVLGGTRSFDPRNIPGSSSAGLGEGGGKGGYAAQEKERKKDEKEQKIDDRRKKLANKLRKAKTRDDAKKELDEMEYLGDIAHVGGKTLARPEVAENLSPRMLKSVIRRAEKGELDLSREQRQEIVTKATGGPHGLKNAEFFDSPEGKWFDS